MPREARAPAGALWRCQCLCARCDVRPRYRVRQRALTAVGLVGVVLIWAAFAYIIFTYGLLIMELLGLNAQRSFTRSWGVSYGVSAATEWRQVLHQAVIVIVFLAVAERLHLTRPVTWLDVAVVTGLARQCNNITHASSVLHRLGLMDHPARPGGKARRGAQAAGAAAPLPPTRFVGGCVAADDARVGAARRVPTG